MAAAKTATRARRPAARASRKPLTVDTESLAAFGALPLCRVRGSLLRETQAQRPFKGPCCPCRLGGFGASLGQWRCAARAASRWSRSSSQRRRSGEQLTICEEDEDEDGVELVDEFSPIKVGETVEMIDER